jgi:hypothetical protein
LPLAIWLPPEAAAAALLLEPLEPLEPTPVAVERGMPGPCVPEAAAGKVPPVPPTVETRPAVLRDRTDGSWNALALPRRGNAAKEDSGGLPAGAPLVGLGAALPLAGCGPRALNAQVVMNTLQRQMGDVASGAPAAGPHRC